MPVSNQIAYKSGESYEYLRTEYEPLGQEVTPEEPIQEFPVGSTAFSFSASEPEWLCQYASKEFSLMPASCQRADNESLEWWLVWRESNPKKIAGEVKTTTGNLGTVINLRATLKPDGSANSGGSATAPASMPSSSGASGPNAEDFKAETDIGSFPVEKSLIDVSDTGGLDAEFSGDEQNPTYQKQDKNQPQLVQKVLKDCVTSIFGENYAYFKFTEATTDTNGLLSINPLSNHDTFEINTQLSEKQFNDLYSSAIIQKAKGEESNLSILYGGNVIASYPLPQQFNPNRMDELVDNIGTLFLSPVSNQYALSIAQINIISQVLIDDSGKDKRGELAACTFSNNGFRTPSR